MMMMVDKAFMDTNVLLRSTVERFPNYQVVKSFVDQYFADNTDLWISRQIIREYLVQVTRPQSFMNPMSASQAIQQIQSMHQIFHIADETNIETRELLQLLQSHAIGGKQIHDANIVATMLTHEIDTLLTLNTDDFKRFADKITLISPLEAN